MYTVENYRSKKQLKLAVASGTVVTLFAPGLGTQAHSWYAQVEMRDGKVIKVK